MPMTGSDILHNADAYQIDRIAARFACGLLNANEAIALLEKAGCTYETACGHLARWVSPGTSFIDPEDEYRQERADHA